MKLFASFTTIDLLPAALVLAGAAVNLAQAPATAQKLGPSHAATAFSPETPTRSEHSSGSLPSRTSSACSMLGTPGGAPSGGRVEPDIQSAIHRNDRWASDGGCNRHAPESFGEAATGFDRTRAVAPLVAWRRSWSTSV
jgi:hypothetical protein